MGHQLPSLRISLLTEASPEDVYDVLADYAEERAVATPAAVGGHPMPKGKA